MVPAYTGLDINTNQGQGCPFGTSRNEDDLVALLLEEMGRSKYPDCDAFMMGPAVNFW